MSKRAKIGGLFEKSERGEQHAAFKRPLSELDESIDWELFRADLVRVGGYTGKGRPPHDPVLMFKIVVLQRYYDLSEEQTEFQILDRLSFQQFLGLESGGKIPDKNSIWDFKERLGESGARDLFDRFDDYLWEVGLRARGGKIVDASFVDVPKQHNERGENAHIKETGEAPESWGEKKASHKDTDARWTKKGDEKHYGYKNHSKVGRVTKLIEDYAVTDAAVHDSQVFEEFMDGETEQRHVGRQRLRERGLAGGAQGGGDPQPRARARLSEPAIERSAEAM